MKGQTLDFRMNGLKLLYHAIHKYLIYFFHIKFDFPFWYNKFMLTRSLYYFLSLFILKGYLINDDMANKS